MSEVTPGRIWLLLHEGDEGEHVWCDDPDPSGNGQAESVEYVRHDDHKAALAAAKARGRAQGREDTIWLAIKLREAVQFINNGSIPLDLALAGVMHVADKLDPKHQGDRYPYAAAPAADPTTPDGGEGV